MLSRDRALSLGRAARRPHGRPLELALGICENATPALVHSIVQGFAAMPLRGYALEMASAHRVIPSRSTLERISQQVSNAIHHEIAFSAPMVAATAEKGPRS